MLAQGPIKSAAKKFGLRKMIERTAGEDAYRRVRKVGIDLDKAYRTAGVSVRQRLINSSTPMQDREHQRDIGIEWSTCEPMMPVAAYDRNFQIVSRALDRSGIDWWLVRGLHSGRWVVGVDSEQRDKVLAALTMSTWEERTPVYVMNAVGPNPQISASLIPQVRDFESCGVLRVCSPVKARKPTFKYGFQYGCDVEFWHLPEGAEKVVIAPRENVASRILDIHDFEKAEIWISGVPYRTPKVFTQMMLDDHDFPIDAVYTWVDGDDPVWIQSKRVAEGAGGDAELHPESNHVARFRSRDELLYSLRSLEMYAPWIRKIYIVTAGQVPAWLKADHPRIVVVDHKEIYDDHERYLPTFNSNSIISRLHHIPGLSEHYVYFNDDVMLGRPVRRDQFFTSGGVALVSPANNRRPFGVASSGDGPHLNLTRNMRALIRDAFGITISRAIKHTPHPQLKSVHFELENRFKDVYEQTWGSRFRHHDDIVADQFHHYYAQIIGKAVPGNLTYNYINILDDSYRGVLEGTLQQRNRDTICVNDAPVPGATPLTDEEVDSFLKRYYPIKSSFEV